MVGYIMFWGEVMAAAGYFGILSSLHTARRAWLARNPMLSAYALLFHGVFALCGLSHICDAMAFVWPAYRSFAVAKLLNGVVACISAVLLFFVVVAHVRIRTCEGGEGHGTNRPRR